MSAFDAIVPSCLTVTLSDTGRARYIHEALINTFRIPVTIVPAGSQLRGERIESGESSSTSDSFGCWCLYPAQVGVKRFNDARRYALNVVDCPADLSRRIFLYSALNPISCPAASHGLAGASLLF
jgi:hypothetical protein